MSEINGLYAIWYREIKVFLREQSRIVGALIQPLLWLVAFGTGLGSVVSISGTNYQTFIYPGILAMTILFGCVFYGMYIILDKRVDFLKEVLVAPLNRTTIFFGKVIGGATDGIIQIVVLMILGSLFFGIHFTVFSVVVTFIVIMLLMISIISVGLTIGAWMSSPEGFGLISSFLIFPLFLLSGALYPTNNLPSWLHAFVAINPVSYAVDALRGAILGINGFGLPIDFAVLIIFAIIMVIVGTESFKRMKI